MTTFDIDFERHYAKAVAAGIANPFRYAYFEATCDEIAAEVRGDK